MDPEIENPAATVCVNYNVKQKCPRCCNWFGKLTITVEPIVLLVCFAAAFSDSVITNLVETRICKLKFNYSSSLCSNPMSESLEQQVQPFASQIIMAKSFIEALLPAMMSFFIGSWSDTNGRKPFILASLTGYVISYALWGVFAYFEQIPASYFLLVTIPISLSGGSVAFFVCLFCYISDITTAANRSFRMVFAQLSVMLGFLFGCLLVPLFYKTSSHSADSLVFAIACICLSAAFFYTLFFLPETINNNNREIQKSFFDISHVKDMIHVVFMKRPNKGRAAVLILVTLCALVVAIFQGDMSVRYLSLRARFSWTLEDFNDFVALYSTISAVASLLGMWFFCKILRIHEIYLALTVSFLGLISAILAASSTNSLSYKLSANIACLTILTGPITRSEVSKIVPKSDLGKAFAFLSSLEAVTPLITPPLYTMVYNLVLKSYPLAVFFVSAILWSVVFMQVIVLIAIYLFYGAPYYSCEESIDEASHSEEETTMPINT